jgi:pullulanase/glycogen debranching enzyme
VDWSLLDDPENRAFFEDIRKYIAIRRAYPEIFEYFPANHRKSNICKVEVQGQPLQAYARYKGNQAVLVAGNNAPAAESFRVTVPFDAMNLCAYRSFTLTDLMTGEVFARGSRSELGSFIASVEYTHIGVYLIEGE